MVTVLVRGLPSEVLKLTILGVNLGDITDRGQLHDHQKSCLPSPSPETLRVINLSVVCHRLST